MIKLKYSMVLTNHISVTLIALGMFSLPSFILKHSVELDLSTGRLTCTCTGRLYSNLFSLFSNTPSVLIRKHSHRATEHRATPKDCISVAGSYA